MLFHHLNRVELYLGDVGNFSVTRTELDDHPPTNEEDAIDVVERVLSSAQHAARATAHSTFGVSPGAIVFQRDMLLPIPMITDIERLRQRRQLRIDADATRQNLRRQENNYQAGGFGFATFSPRVMPIAALPE